MLACAITDIALKDYAGLQRCATADTPDEFEIGETIEITMNRHLADAKEFSKLVYGCSFPRTQELQYATTPRLSH